MKKAKLSDLWQEVDDSLAGTKSAGIKFAIIEAQKILENTLKSQGYPGRTIEKKLYWAGYSLADEGGINEALEKRKEILNNFEFQLSDLEAEEIVKLYNKVVQEIVTKPQFSFSDKFRAFFKVYLSPKSIYFWRNLAITFAALGLVKVLTYTTFGQTIMEFVVYVADLAFSLVFVAVAAAATIIFLLVSNYFEKRSKILIKE